MQTRQDKILDYCLKNAAFDGWTDKLLEDACISAELDKNYWKILFPKGVLDLFDYYATQIDQKIANGLVKPSYQNLRTHEKIRELIKLRLELLKPNKEAIKTILQKSLLHPAHATNSIYKITNNMWYLAGDTATDWNFYSKRFLLSGVYTSTLIFWLNDNSQNNSETWEFLDRRLGNVAKFGKVTAKLKSLIPPLREA